jgi:LysM repeat protein
MAFAGCIFGGGGGAKAPTNISRPNSIPTATPPASLPAPILLGASQANAAGGSGTPAAGAAAANSYTIQPGDSLLVIAGKLNVPAEQQAQWIADVLRLNNIADATLLKAGQTLDLPKLAATPRPTGTVQSAGTSRPSGSATPAATSRPTGSATAPPALVTSTPSTPSGGSGSTYTVQSGDSPVSIAAKLGVPVAQQQAWANQLLSLNNTSATGLQVGQVLQLPPIPR